MPLVAAAGALEQTAQRLLQATPETAETGLPHPLQAPRSPAGAGAGVGASPPEEPAEPAGAGMVEPHPVTQREPQTPEAGAAELHTTRQVLGAPEL